MKLSFWSPAFLSIVLIILSLPLSGQQGLGWLTDPHAGISAAFLQPAATSTTPYNWDFTIGGVGANVRNNFTFLKGAGGASFLQQLRSGNEISFSETEFSFSIDDQKYFYDFPEGERSIYASLSAEVLGPSFSIQLGNYTRVGAFTRLRALASTRSIDADLNFYPYDAFGNNVDIPINESYAAATAWGEIGFHLSRAFALGYDGELRIGISPKYLMGIEGATASNPEGAAIRQLGGDSLIVSNLDAELAFTNAFRQGESGNGPAGTGFGIDLGVQYAWGEADGAGHRYTIGFSVLDLGGITFDRGAQVHRFANSGQVLFDAEDYEIENDDYTDEAIRRLAQNVYDGGTFSQTGDEFTVSLPTAISAQFSVKPIDDVVVSAVYRDDLPLRNEQLSQGSQLVAAAHYSKWWYGAGLTAGVYDWDQFNLGLQLRLGPLYLGTDQLFGALLKRKELSGGSFYLGLRMHDFGGQKRGRGKGRSRNNRRGGKDVKCYDF
jgi:hypothetical protein